MLAYVGVLLAAVALGGALAMHNEITSHVRPLGGRSEAYSYDTRPGWVGPAAITIAVAGIGSGALMVVRSRRRPTSS